MPDLRPPLRKPRENRTRYVVLGMLASSGPLTGYALRQRIRGSVGHFWQESFGQLYPALRALAAAGLVQGKATRGGPGRPGATWRITDRGRAELGRWLAAPPAFEPQRNELLLRVFFAGAVPTEVTARNLELVGDHLRAQLDGLEALAAHWEEETGGHPDAPYWRLTLDFGLTLLRAATGWLGEAQGVLAAQQRARSRGHHPLAAPGADKAHAVRSGGTR